MDLFFCDICNESVPQSDLDQGNAFRRGERVVCAACDKAMSYEDMMTAKGSGETASSEADAAAPDETPADASGAGSDSGAEAPADAPAEGSKRGEAPTVSAPAGRAQGGNLIGNLSGCLVVVLLVLGYIWGEEFLKKQGEFAVAIESLESGDDAMDKRFSDLQISMSRQGQEKDTYLNQTLETMNGKIDEKFSNLGNRIGRLENSLEALRQSASEDRRVLEAGTKEAATAAALAKNSTDAMKEELGYLADRVNALEEVLEGGLVAGGGDTGGGRQPNWFSHLPELKDASAGNRWNAVTVLGDTRDPRVVPHLLPMLTDEDVFVRMATARVLGDLGSPAAVPGLIDALSDTQAAVREAAVVALRVLTGKDFRFDPLGKDADRRKTQGAWRKWWEDNSEDLLGS